MTQLNIEINDAVRGRSKPLDNETGICGEANSSKGILWIRAKVRAMEKDAPDDEIIVSAIQLLKAF